MLRRSITVRLATMFALAALVTFSLIGAALYGVLGRELAHHQDQELDTRVQGLRYFIERTADEERWARVRAKMDNDTPADGRVRFWVLSDDARFQYGHGVDELLARISQEPSGHGQIVLPSSGQTMRTMSLHIAAFGGRPAVRLIVGVDVAPFEHTLRRFLVALALVSFSAMLLVLVLGWWIARLGLRPVRRLSAEAQALRPNALSQRLSVANLPVELSDLAQALNGAFGRLETAYQQLEAFNADVAHELRTPLANLIGGTQVALSRPRSAAEFEEVLQSNLEELERLRSIINDMLFLARADQGEAATGLVETRVADEVAKTIDFFDFILDEAGLSIRLEGEVEARATLEPALFRRALSNLLQNAIEHSAAGAALVVTIDRSAPPGAASAGGNPRPATALPGSPAPAPAATSDGAVWIGVSNPGAPVAALHLPRLFDRFYRVDAARQDIGQHHGHGLGLAIVKAVASMHGGRVGAVSEGGLTTVWFSFRGVAPAAPRALAAPADRPAVAAGR